MIMYHPNDDVVYQLVLVTSDTLAMGCAGFLLTGLFNERLGGDDFNANPPHRILPC